MGSGHHLLPHRLCQLDQFAIRACPRAPELPTHRGELARAAELYPQRHRSIGRSTLSVRGPTHHSHPLSHTLTHSLSLSLSHSHIHTHTLSLSFSLSRSLSLIHTRSHVLSLSHTLSFSLSFFLSLAHSLTLTLTLSHASLKQDLLAALTALTPRALEASRTAKLRNMVILLYRLKLVLSILYLYLI